ncbi:putative IMP dehydrogenase/GMP reductase, partial [Trifolium medium]|nr:putative IMP dehydrogenase/GMP reductase [Trifolium medium]
LDSALLFALAERWHEETNSFHLLVEEIIVILDDVSCLLHLSIEGRLLDHPDIMTRFEVVDLMVELIRI